MKIYLKIMVVGGIIGTIGSLLAQDIGLLMNPIQYLGIVVIIFGCVIMGIGLGIEIESTHKLVESK